MEGKLSDLQSAFLFDLSLTLRAPVDIGLGPEGRRLIVMTSGGSFEGPRGRRISRPPGAVKTVDGIYVGIGEARPLGLDPNCGHNIANGSQGDKYGERHPRHGFNPLRRG